MDLGGTKLSAALISSDAQIIHVETIPLEGRKGDEVGTLIIEQATFLLKIAKAHGFSVNSLGICVPGIAYAGSGCVWAPNVGDWENYPLLDVMQKGLGKDIRIRIDSDRACYILGEVWTGNARGCSDVIFLAVGTGIGAGIMCNNKVIRGTGDIAGAIGWMALDKPFDDKFKSCGCFEYNASGEGLVKIAREMIVSGKFASHTFRNDNITARELFDGYARNDALSKAVMQNAIEYWGMAAANLVSLFNPEKIIFGGGIFGPALQFLDAIYDEAKKWAQPISIGQVKFEAASLGNEAGLYGAAYLVFKDE
jgi:glucokinase